MPSRRRCLAVLLTCVLAAIAGISPAGQPTTADRALANKLVQQAEERYGADDLLGALRAYQRAWFWLAGPLGSAGEAPPPQAPEPEWLQEIVPLAISLNRIDEALRYAVLLPSSAVDDPPTLRKLALLAREKRNWSTAAGLQQRWLASPDGPRERFERLLGELEIGRLRYLADEAGAASRSFEKVERTLADPSTPQRVRRQLTVALGGSLATTWEVFGQAHFEAGRLDKAAAAFAQIPPASRQTPSVRYWQARVALAQRRPLAAYELLASGPATPYGNGYDTTWGKLLGQVYAQLNQPAQAVDDLRRVAETTPSSVTLPTLLGLALVENVPAGEAPCREAPSREASTLLAKALRRAARSEGRDPLFADADSGTKAEIDYVAIAAAGEWLIANQAAAGQSEPFLQTINDLHTLFKTLEDFDETLTKALGKHPGFAKALFAGLEKNSKQNALPPAAQAELAAAAGRHDAAANAFRRAVVEADADERQAIAFDWWRTMMLKEQHMAAAAAMRESIDSGLWPDGEYEPYYHLAAGLALADKPEEAFAAAVLAADRAPRDIDANERVGWTLLQANRNAEAIDRYAGLVEVFESEADPPTRNTLRSVRLSLSYLTDEQGDPAKAAEWALEVLDEFPDNAGALNDLAYLWTKRGEHLPRALRMTRRAVALEPDSYAYRDSLAWVEHRLGNHAAALESIRQAIAMQEATGNPADGEILDHLGEILAALDRRSEAADAWRRSADAYKTDGETERAASVRKKAAAPTRDAATDAVADPPSRGGGAGL